MKKIAAILLLIAIGTSTATAQVDNMLVQFLHQFVDNPEKPTPLYFRIEITNSSEYYSAPALKGITVGAIEQNLPSRFTRSYNEEETHTFAVIVETLDATSPDANVGVAFHVTTRFESGGPFASLSPVIVCEVMTLTTVHRAGLDYIQDTIDREVTRAFACHDEMVEYVLEWLGDLERDGKN